MLGIGLGAFVEGVDRGLGLRDDIDQSRDGREQRQIARDRRDALRNIDRQAESGFDSAVAAGEYDADQFQRYYVEQVVPQKRDELLRQGDPEAASAWEQWARSDDAVRGARLFGSAMWRAQTGDYMGAIEDAIAASEMKGYIDGGYEVVGHDEIADSEGNVLGYRITMKDQNGREFSQDVAPQDVARMIAVMVNPEAAYEARTAAAGAQAEADREVDTDLRTYAGRAAIDNAAGSGPAAELRADAIKALRERYPSDGLGLSEEDPFDSRSAEEQERMISDEISLQTGRGRGAGAPGGGERVVVDTRSGQQVEPGQTAPPAGAGTPSNEQLGVITPNEPQAPGATAAPASARPAPPRHPARVENSRRELIVQASSLLQNGANPAQVAQKLQEAGISPQEWPVALQRAAAGSPRADIFDAAMP